jgi:manganese-dependent inorganic pyrophosphatase
MSLYKWILKNLIVTGLKCEISQINAVDLNNVLDRQAEIEESMKKLIALKNLDAIIVSVTDIINCNSEIIALGKRIDVVEKAFNVKLQNNRAFLPCVVSRKKQIAPQIMEASKQ